MLVSDITTNRCEGLTVGVLILVLIAHEDGHCSEVLILVLVDVGLGQGT